jgi:hypothetical protein
MSDGPVGQGSRVILAIAPHLEIQAWKEIPHATFLTEPKRVLMLAPAFFVHAFDASVDPSLEYRGLLNLKRVIPISTVTPPSADRPPFAPGTQSASHGSPST